MLSRRSFGTQRCPVVRAEDGDDRIGETHIILPNETMVEIMDEQSHPLLVRRTIHNPYLHLQDTASSL